MTVSVIIPWKGGDRQREANLEFVLRWWARNHPDWNVVVGEDSTEPRWCKALALYDGARLAGVKRDDVVVVADADVICDGVVDAVAAVGRDTSPPLWGMPHRYVCRLTPETTRMMIEGTWEAPTTTTIRIRDLRPYAIRTYKAFPGGGLVVVSGHLLEDVPMDPRFIGWGQEDHSWALALSALGSFPSQGPGLLYHLWHPEEPRMSQGVGSYDGLRLWHRYRCAATSPAMAELVAEARSLVERTLGTS